MKLCVGVVVLGLFTGLVYSIRQPSAEGEKAIKFVAAVEGKSYFAELHPSRNWTNAGLQCESLGLRLATVTSAAQANALKTAHSEDFSGGYWVAAHDSLRPSSFVWNGTNEQLSEEYLDFGDNTSYGIQTCIYFWIGSSSSMYYFHPCSEGSGTLCETK